MIQELIANDVRVCAFWVKNPPPNLFNRLFCKRLWGIAVLHAYGLERKHHFGPFFLLLTCLTLVRV